MNKNELSPLPAPIFQRILIIKLRHHGDTLLITPVIHSLRDNYPDARIDVLLYKETRDMLTAHPDIHRIFIIDRQWKKQSKWHQLKNEYLLLKTLRAQRYQLVVNLADQWRSAFITAFTGAAVRLGFDYPKRRNCLWRCCHTQLASTLDHKHQHIVEQNLSLLSLLTLPELNQQVTMAYTCQDWQTVRQRLQQLPVGDSYIVIQPTSRWRFKCWKEENIAKVINALPETIPVILTSGPDQTEQAMIQRIQALCPAERVFSLAGQLTLRQLAALIAHARLFIGVDSVPMHMAAAVGTPLVALFGPSKLTHWRPWRAKGQVIWAGDYGMLPDPDDVDTGTQERYLNLIPPHVVIDAALKELS